MDIGFVIRKENMIGPYYGKDYNPDPTKCQIAKVMLLHGTPKQKEQALVWLGILKEQLEFNFKEV